MRRFGSAIRLAQGALVGPLIDEAAFQTMQEALAEARTLGGKVFGGERSDQEQYPDAYYVKPALVEMPAQIGPVLHETFAPILYVMKYTDFDEAIALHNGVPQGLSSSIFSTDMREVERFLSVEGRLRDRQRQHRAIRRRDRRRIRWRKRNRRWA